MIRKTLSIVCALVLALASVPALAAPETVDLSAMTFKDLQALEARVLAAMWASGDWQEVKVPAGAYAVGSEIPAGKWTITITPGNYAEIYVCTELNAYGNGAGGHYSYDVIAAEDHYMYDSYPIVSVTVDVKAGMFIVIEDAPVLFTPYSGPSFTFR